MQVAIPFDKGGSQLPSALPPPIASFGVGEAIAFIRNGKQYTGVIASLTGDMAQVKLTHITGYDSQQETTTQVAVGILRRTSDAPIAKSTLIELERYWQKWADKKLSEFGLTNWRFYFDSARRRAGKCNHTLSEISVSKFFIGVASYNDIADCILHEIAHALAGYQNHHNHKWQAIALRIGCTAERCHTVKFFRGAWLQYCPNGCFPAREVHRRKSQLLCRKCKSGIEYRARAD